MVFWNLTHEARIRPFLERTVVKLATFSRPAEKGDVTMNAIFGTWNRVSRACSKNPQIQICSSPGAQKKAAAVSETVAAFFALRENWSCFQNAVATENTEATESY